MKISVISFTRTGAVKNLEVTGLLQEKKHQAASFSWHKYTGRKLIPFQKLDQLLIDFVRYRTCHAGNYSASVGSRSGTGSICDG